MMTDDKVALIEQLQRAEDEGERCYAAEDLVAFGDDPAVIDALVAAMESDADRGVQEAACSALVQINSAEVFRHAARLVGCEDAYVRNAASDILAESESVPDEIFAEMMKSDDPDVRIFATVTVDNRRVRTLLPLLVDILYHDDNINVVSAAINALGNLGCRDVRDDGSSDVDALLAAGRRFADEPFISFAVNGAIEQIEDEAASGN
ncbi:MAG: HEAT repeat domain-containing protein [Mariprofundales bacterium]|nr:HEAT repeat domain-containing protein [Mariprofundales bacterium]